MDKDRILIIDDSVVQANMLTSILEADYEITQAHTAEEGLSFAREGNFSLILLDVIMPGMDGFNLLRKLQEEVITQHTPVILITSLRDAEHEEWGLVLGAVDYITKPYHPHIVRARVNTHIKLYHYRQEIERQALVDPMTGVLNRRSYDASHMAKWQDAIRLKVPISLCMMDIDEFKVYNDTFGHPAGDKVICTVAKTVDACLRRSTDFFARYGGEEFVAIMLGGDSDTVFHHMVEIRQEVENLHIAQSSKVGPWITVSIGGVTLVPKASDDYETYLKIADVMCYDAKRMGRNQVVWTNEKMEQLKEIQ